MSFPYDYKQRQKYVEEKKQYLEVEMSLRKTHMTWLCLYERKKKQENIIMENTK